MRHRHRRLRPAIFLCLLLLLLLAGFLRLDAKLRPLVQEYGYTAAKRGAMLAAHAGMEEALATATPAYDELVKTVRSEDGRVLSVEADVVAIDALKAAAVNAVMQKLEEYEVQTVRVPLGNLIGGAFFTGRGPFLSVPFRTSGAVIVTLSDSFESAGINQTCHRLYLTMEVTMTAALPLEYESITVSTDFLVGESVLLGEVPTSYGGFGFTDTALSKKFGTEN